MTDSQQERLMDIPALWFRIWWQMRYRLWAIRVAVSRLTGDRISAPPTAPACWWDIAEEYQNCDHCPPEYKGGGPVEVGLAGGRRVRFCCPKGYEGATVLHPITKQPIGVSCI